ncbi:MAG: hypothetical protein Q7J82_05600 [Coriobacteriia bacterium]|nr:hypothetical protein [Coriobacteriia bacterium]
MAFFLIDRDRTDDSLRLLSAESFSTREAALQALPGLMSADEGYMRDVFVCDLNAATPVLFVQQPAQSAAGIVSASEVGEEEPVAEIMEPESIVSEEIIEIPADGLADALRRAATSLEAEGIVTPESIVSVADTEDLVEEEASTETSDVTDELAQAIASLGVEIPEEPVAGEPEASDTTSTDWPWANVDKVELETQEPEFVPRPVIMGDYNDEVVVPAAVELDEAGLSTASTYEPGEIELGDYSCDDCVYANTCPKAGTSNPSECGSFQWKSV